MTTNVRPKRIILSRKGFDSSDASGGQPSPILENKMFSMPIPEMLPHKTHYRDIKSPFEGFSDAGKIAAQITKNKITGEHAAHLDPDLRHDALVERHVDWRPVYGQDVGFQTELRNSQVKEGDLFLFYGLFRKVAQQETREELKLAFVRGSPRKHIMFGWLCIGEIIPVANAQDADEWVRYHSHVYDNCRPNNALYVAAEKVFDNLPGAGIFPFVHSRLQLTQEGESCSVWKLPGWFDPQSSGLGRNPYLDKNGNPRWKRLPDGDWQVLTTSPGQEYVFDAEFYLEGLKWAEGLIREFGDYRRSVV
jgi:hypothetical protein